MSTPVKAKWLIAALDLAAATARICIAAEGPSGLEEWFKTEVGQAQINASIITDAALLAVSVDDLSVPAAIREYASLRKAFANEVRGNNNDFVVTALFKGHQLARHSILEQAHEWEAAWIAAHEQAA